MRQGQVQQEPLKFPGASVLEPRLSCAASWLAAASTLVENAGAFCMVVATGAGVPDAAQLERLKPTTVALPHSPNRRPVAILGHFVGRGGCNYLDCDCHIDEVLGVLV